MNSFLTPLLRFTSFPSYIRKYYYRKKYRKEYYRQFLPAEDVFSLAALLESSGEECFTESPVLYQGVSFGSSEWKVSARLGRSQSTFSIPMWTATYRIRVHLRKVGQVSVISYCHFLDGELFLVQNCMDRSDQSLSVFLIQTLENKYGCRVQKPDACTLVDAACNRLKLGTVPALHSYVISGRPVFRDKLSREVRYQERLRQQSRRHHYKELARAIM